MVKEEKKKKGTQMETAFPGLMVSDRVELRDVRLISAKCSQTPESAHGKKTYKIDHSAKVQTDEKNGYIIVIPEFHFEAFGEDKTKEPVVLIDVSFILAYKIDNFQGLTQKGFEQFANLNGIYNAWPYWREFVQNTIIRMGLPSLSIPVFRIVKSSKEKSIKKNGRKRKLAKESYAKT
jgi:preprotein translocase subunit SecB